MVGPILGPTLGGYLTEYYNWRWVFYINLPFGMLALAGILTVVPETVRNLDRRFDIFGFALLSLAIGALQMMLDRGESQDWFSSTEIIVETVIAALCFYMFLVQMFTAKNPFIEPGLFKDRNFAAGLVVIFMVGIILLATLALLPPFLQSLMGYPVLTTGYILAPRGIGTMVAMIIVGRLNGRIDARALILLGICLISVSLYEMSTFTVDIPMATLIWTGIIQGFGLGFIFVPLSTVAFSTLNAKYRNEGTAMFSLMRNIGSSIGISVVVTLLAQNTQINHANIGELMNPFREMMHQPLLPQSWDWHTTSGLAALNGEVTRQATTIGYLNNFIFMMWITLAAIPMLFLIRPKRKQ